MLLASQIARELWAAAVDDGNPVSFTTLVRWFGLPGAIFAAFIVLLTRGYFVTGREAIKDKKAAEAALAAERERRVAEVAALQARYDADACQWRERYVKIETEKDFWRDAALKNMEALEEMQVTARKAVEKLPRKDSR